MFRSLVVPLDGSPLAAKALTYAGQLADTDSRISLVGVVQPPLDEYFRDTRRAEVTELMERASDFSWKEVERRAEELRARGLRAVTTVRRGDPTEEIITCAREAEADLIVMTTHGWGGIRRWILGSVANRILHTTTIPILTVRVAESEGLTSPAPIDGIIVALDGSPFAEQALPTAQDVATRLTLPLDIIRVVEDEMTLARRLGMADATISQRLTDAAMAERTQAQEYLEAVAAPMRASGCTVHTHVLSGDPAAMLTDAIAARPYAIVVMATHGQHGSARWVFGSVAEKIISSAANPILSLRPSTAEATPASSASALAVTA